MYLWRKNDTFYQIFLFSKLAASRDLKEKCMPASNDKKKEKEKNSCWGKIVK